MHGENLANGAKPGCSLEAENALDRQNANEEQFRTAAETALRDAGPQTENGCKVELAKRCLVRALKLATRTA
jgi:xanthine dehydrogenase YagS FAD-binding subunit